MWLLLLTFAVSQAAIPDWLSVCKTSDPKLEECITKTLEDLRPRLKSGIPEIGLSAMEPLFIPQLVIDRPQEKFNATAYNFTVYGLGDFMIKDLKVNPKNNEYRITVHIPEIHLDNTFDIDATIIVPLKGRGSATLYTKDCFMDVVMSGKRVKRKGMEYLNFDKIQVTMSFKGKNWVVMKGLFGDNDLLMNAMNGVLNENSGEFAEAVRPYLEFIAHGVILENANKVTSKYTYQELFPEK